MTVKRALLGVLGALALVGSLTPGASAAASTDEVLNWYDQQSTSFIDSLSDQAYTFRVEAGTVLGSMAFRGARDPRGDLRMSVESPFVSGDLRCVNDRRCWFRPQGERTWQELAAQDVTVDDDALEITGGDLRETLAQATVVSFDQAAGRAVVNVSGEGQVSITVTPKVLRLRTSESSDGMVSESVVELRPRSPFQVKAPAKKLRVDGQREYDFTVPGIGLSQ